MAAVAAIIVCSAQAQTPAFPGAEGFGMYTTGGRGGKVLHVTNLSDDGKEGSLRWAVNQSGARTIVFDVSGTIHLTKQLDLRNANLTIAGQTAPGDGICIADWPVVLKGNNMIIRFVRFRLGNKNVASHEGDGLGGMDLKNIIVDHCSVSWSIDECLSVYGSENLTVQWCIVSQSLKNSGHSKGAHGYGGNWGGKGASYHHNLLCHHDSRTPRLGPRPGTQTDERMDMRNNVIYNWGGNGCYGGEAMNVNIVNNYYKPGPLTKSRSASIQKRIACVNARTLIYCLDKATTRSNYNSAFGASVTADPTASLENGKAYITIDGKKCLVDMNANTATYNGTSFDVAWNSWKPTLHQWGKYYVSGNYNPSHSDVTADNFTVGVANQIDRAGSDGTYPGDAAIKLTAPIDVPTTTTHSAAVAYDRVLQYAGASLKRDAVDAQMVADTRNGTAAYGNKGIIDSQDDLKPSGAAATWSAWPTLNSATRPTDTDGDGMPDAWEKANGLDPNDASDANTLNADGYTMLEVYMNSLVEHIVDGGNAEGIADEPSSEPTARTFEISSATYTSSPATTTWNFGSNISVSNANAKGYGKGIDGAVKYSKGVQYTISLPDGVKIGSVKIKGYNNYADSEAYLSELDGTTYTDEYTFDPKDSAGNPVWHEYNIKLTEAASGSLTFTFGGQQTAVIITLGEYTATPIKQITTGAHSDYIDVYDLSGRLVHRQMHISELHTLRGGTYIAGGELIRVM